MGPQNLDEASKTLQENILSSLMGVAQNESKGKVEYSFAFRFPFLFPGGYGGLNMNIWLMRGHTRDLGEIYVISYSLQMHRNCILSQSSLSSHEVNNH
jgi:hypothetical protein